MAKKNARFTALIAAAAVIFVVFVSSVGEIISIDHDCPGESCSVCAAITAAVNVIRTISGGGLHVSTGIFTVLMTVIAVAAAVEAIFGTTPVSSKVRLND